MDVVKQHLQGLVYGPSTHSGHLAVVPLLAREGIASPPFYDTLKDAIGAGTARVTEISEGGSVPELLVVNDGPRPVTYVLSNVDTPAAIRAVSHAQGVPSTSSVTVEQRGRRATRITVRPREHVRVDVRIVPDPALPAGALYGGFLVFAPEDGAQPLRVPYAGYHGDYQAVPAMTPTAQGYPWLARKTGIALDAEFHVRPVYERAAAGASFTFASRLSSDSVRSPTCAATLMTSPNTIVAGSVIVSEATGANAKRT